MTCNYCEKIGNFSIMDKKDEGKRWIEYICKKCGSKKSVLKEEK